MAKGDWAPGTVGQLALGATTNLTATGMEVQANWYATQPSGRNVWAGIPGGQPFVFTTTDLTLNVQALSVAVAQALANAEGIPVVLANGQQVNPQ